MDELKKLIDICVKYKAGEFDIQEFQGLLGMVCLPSECKHTLERVQHDAHNRLEEIIFSYTGDNLLRQAEIVADRLIVDAVVEQRRLSPVKYA